jgi:DNA (cytosine-5)-methyltransferase 1
MHDGSLFNFTTPQQPMSDLPPMIIDSFAGGGGASTGIERALGRSPDVAINHDAQALSMHAANHPQTLHLNSNIWTVDPAEVCRGRRVGLAWFSPDCKHHSRAKGGKPVEKNIRDLAWIVTHWAARVRPEVILLENVEEFQDWGPLTPENRPDPEGKGKTFAEWVARLRSLKYKVEWATLRACDFGAPTIRKRLFLTARCDSRPIIWPEPTHGKLGSPAVLSGRLSSWASSASIVDWTLPCPSIFETADQIMAQHGLRAVRPLQDATLRRIARGVMRYVVDAAEPFIISVAHGYSGGRREYPISDPLGTQSAGGIQHGLIVPSLVQTGYGEAPGQAPRSLDINAPLGTLVGTTKHALVAAFLAQHNTGVIGRDAREPLSTLTTTGAQQQVVAAHLMNMHGSARSSRDLAEPHPAICAGGQHGTLVAAFLQKYYGQGAGQDMDAPLHTVSTRDTFGLVTVQIDGQTYAIADIGMRMLTPREQFRAQGFPDDYIIDHGHDGAPMPKTAQTRMCGNSVSPACAEALVRANCAHLMAANEVAA